MYLFFVIVKVPGILTLLYKSIPKWLWREIYWNYEVHYIISIEMVMTSKIE